MSILAIGLVNSQNEFMAIKNLLVSGKDAKSTCQNIMTALPSSVLNRISGSIGDSAHAQILTQKLVHQTLQAINGDEKERKSFVCGLHTKCSCQRKHQEAMAAHFQQFYRDLQLSFGGRRNEGIRQESLKTRLDDELVEFQQKVPGIKFLSNLGSRTGSIGANATALLVYKNEVQTVCEETIAEIEETNDKKKRETRMPQMNRLKRILSYIEPSRIQHTMVHLGAHISLWYGIAQRIGKLENHKFTVREKKEIIRTCEERYRKLLSKTDHGECYERLLAITATADLSEAQKKVIKECGESYLTAPRELKKEVNDYICESSTEGLKKLIKDTKPYTELEDSDNLVVSTNQMCESVFGIYKFYELQYPSMSTDMIEVLTRCARNKV